MFQTNLMPASDAVSEAIVSSYVLLYINWNYTKINWTGFRVQRRTIYIFTTSLCEIKEMWQ